MVSETDNINKVGKGNQAFRGGSSFRKASERSEIVEGGQGKDWLWLVEDSVLI